MIRIALLTHNGSFASLEVKGHANSAPKGEDLVCSAVSAIVLGGLSALTDGDDAYEVAVEEGHVRLLAKRQPSEHDETVIFTIVTQLESVARDHPSHAKLERKQA